MIVSVICVAYLLYVEFKVILFPVCFTKDKLRSTQNKLTQNITNQRVKGLSLKFSNQITALPSLILFVFHIGNICVVFSIIFTRSF